MKVRIREAILVEGRYDKNTLSQIVDTSIFQSDGFGIFNDTEIRNHLKSCLPKEKLLHAYIPDVPGKECRKKKPSKEGLLGVEGMTPEIILTCLRRCGAHFLDNETAFENAAITRQDLYLLGLMGGTESSKLREYVKQQFQLPAHLGTSAFLDALNLITTLEEVKSVLERKPVHKNPL